MPGKNERETHKQLRDMLRLKEEAEFNAGLPMSRKLFMALFNYLDIELRSKTCDNSLKATDYFLAGNGVTNISAVKDWMADKGDIVIVRYSRMWRSYSRIRALLR
jgi:hypothetical protein